ncbi:MAG: lytic transglycosylase domain-containing protein [Chitinophagia bacterium]|nr:lytic transglycosylase domain-containing protein [Chitinophagia bacterium]
MYIYIYQRRSQIMKKVLSILALIATIAHADDQTSCMASYIQASNPRITHQTALNIANAARYAAYSFDRDRPHYVHPYVLLAIAKNESSFNPGVGRNKYGAHGLMQVVPRYHQTNITKAVFRTDSDSLDDLSTNMVAGAEAFREMITRARGSRTKAVQLYAGFNTQAEARPYLNKMLTTIKQLSRACGV